MRSIVFGSVLALSALSVANAQKYSNEFLTIPVGAKAQAMGGAIAASVDDVYSGFWNPAGLTGVTNDMQLGYMHSEWFAGIAKFDFGAVAVPIADKKRNLGFSFVRFGIDNIPNTLSLYDADGSVNYNNISRFSAADYAFLVSYAQKTGIQGLSIGGNVKIINRSIGPFANAWGFGIDLGAQYKYKNWNFGILAKDITGTFNAWAFHFTDKEKDILAANGNVIPINSIETTLPRVILAAGYHKDFVLNKSKVANGAKAKNLNFNAEINLALTTDGKRNVLVSGKPVSMDPYMGTEIGYDDIIYLRAGINNIQQYKDYDNNKVWTLQPTFGVGLHLLKVLRIDYALNLGNASTSLNSHIISARLDLNYKKS